MPQVTRTVEPTCCVSSDKALSGKVKDSELEDMKNIYPELADEHLLQLVTR